MNHGPLIFLGVLATFVASWWSLIFAPQIQIGSQQNVQPDGSTYPYRRAGFAEQGHQVYVANGCVQCHGQQVRQDGYTFDLVLTSAGTNSDRVEQLLKKIAPEANAKEIIAKASDTSPQPILTNIAQGLAEDHQKTLKKAGATAQPVFIPLGSDQERGWGKRLSVGADYLFEYPVQVGNSRLGPDLANVGARNPDANWHLLHLYNPRTVVEKSIMPAYQYLFVTRPLGKKPSPNALKLDGKFAREGFEVVPTTEALQLVAYLQSLRADTLLFEAPMTQLAPPPAASGTNAPATNAVPAAPKP
jgi:cbb3-type cytochrome oxidase cytochrome c subunit